VRLPALLLVVACATGCGANYQVVAVEHPPVSALTVAPENKALICVYRNSNLGAALTVAIRDNDQVVGATEGSSWFCYLAEPGRHFLTVEGSDADDLGLVALGGHRKFVELRINMGQDELVVRENADAERVIHELDYLVIEEGPDDQPVPPALPFARARR
jgi:hypothetical protein